MPHRAARRAQGVRPVDADRGIYEWVYRQGPRRGELMQNAPQLSPAEVLARRRLRTPVRTAIPLVHSSPPAVVNQLRPFFVGAGGQSALVIGGVGNGDHGLLLISGYSHEVADAIEMIGLLERPSPRGDAADADLEAWRARVDRRLDAIERRMGH